MFIKKKLSKKPIESTRVVVVGAGNVGAASAYAILTQGIASEIVLVDIDKNKCQGECLDLEHGISLAPHAKVWAGDYEDCKDADVVVITAGIKQKEGQSRLELVGTNSKIIAEIVKNITKYTKNAIILMVTNPLDVMTYIALKKSKLPSNQVFGTGTTLDSSRFRYLLAQELNVAADSVGAYMLGEHGDSSVPIYSHANIMGENLSSLPGFNKKLAQRCFKDARDAAYQVISKKGATFYAIGLAVARIVRAILYNEQHAFTVSVYMTGQQGINDVCLSMPAIIGRNGVEQILDIRLSAAEKAELQKSGKVIRETLDGIK